jgi:dihydrolipoamide dehydrogenase
LRKEDDDIAVAVRSALERDGIDVVCDATIAHVARSGDQRVVTYTTGDATASVHVDAVMLASGRVPKLDGLDVAAAGIIGDAAHLAVDPYLRTTNGNVYVAGDALGRRCLVHVAEYAGKLAARNAFSASPIAADFDRFEAHAVYTQPQVAVAGLTERSLRERGIPYSVRRHPFRDIGKALVSDEAEGFIAMMADRDGRIRGVKIFADDAIDLIGEAIALIDRGATVREIAEMPHLHPTMGEIYARVADDLLEAVPAP